MASPCTLGSVDSLNDTDVLIIGAGISGLTSAYELLQRVKNLRVLVLEAKERVGGRTYSVALKTGQGRKEMFDFGGQWVSSLHIQLLNLLKKLGLELIPQYCSGYVAGKAGTPIWKTFKYFPLFGTWFTRYEMYRFIQKVEEIVSEILVTNPMNYVKAEEFDRMTMETFLLDNLFTQAGRDIVRTIIRMQFGTEPTDVSVLFFMVHCQVSSGLTNQFRSTEKGLREFRIKGGAQQISQRLVQNIGKQLILLGDPVVEIVQDSIHTWIATASGKLFRTEYVIVAIPPQEILRIEFNPPLPTQLKHVLQRYLPGRTIQFVMTYEKPFWRDSGYSGEIVDYGEMKTAVSGCTAGPLTMTCDVTTEKGAAALMGQITSNAAMQWSAKSIGTRKGAILETLSDLWGERVQTPIDYHEVNWSEVQFVGGCPKHFLGPGTMAGYNSLREPFGRIHWAGTETANRWMGFMNGAVQAGQRACIEVLYELRPQTLSACDLESIGDEFLLKEKPLPSPFPLAYRLIYGTPFPLLGVACIVFYCLLRYFSRSR